MITINELFSGIGAQVAAFKRLGLFYEVAGISEIDKYAIKSYEAINGSTQNYGDITKIEALDYADLWTYSSPCQDFSTAGRQNGIYNADGTLTRSGLLLHVERLLTDSVIRGDQPKYLLMENVKGLVSKKFKPDFERWLEKLEQLGYNNYWQVLNAKDYGIPQNRERVFVVSIRKDVDTKGYKFPSPVPLQLKLKDLLESEVDERYYLSQEKVEKFLKTVKDVSNTIRVGGRGSLDYRHLWDVVNVESQVLTPKRTDYGKSIRKDYEKGNIKESRHNMTIMVPRNDGTSNTLTTVQKDNLVVQIGNIVNTDNWNNPQSGRIDSPAGCSPTLNTCGGDGSKVKIVIGSTQKNAFVGSTEKYSPCLTQAMGMGGGQTPMHTDYTRIRKLTPLECWRLMGFTDEEFILAQIAGVSNSQLYKQAGNSIVVDVLVAIFKELFNDRL